jgi:hypothetical protein
LQYKYAIYKHQGTPELNLAYTMLFFFFAHLLSTRTLLVPAVDEASVPSSCKDIGNSRTLLGIIWSCITTIFLCTWVSIHPNIPEPADTRRMSFWRKWVHKITRLFGDKATMFICALLIPEYILAWAMRQHLIARKIVKENGA